MTIQNEVSPRSKPGRSKWNARMYAMPIAVPGMARISVLSASSAPRPGTVDRARSHAMGTPTPMQITTASPE